VGLQVALAQVVAGDEGVEDVGGAFAEVAAREDECDLLLRRVAADGGAFDERPGALALKVRHRGGGAGGRGGGRFFRRIFRHAPSGQGHGDEQRRNPLHGHSAHVTGRG
jgi:hypothetical protein